MAARPAEFQDVAAEWEPAVPGSAELCDSPRTFIPFEKPIERQVYDVVSAYNTGLDETMERLVAKTVVEESGRYGLDPWLVVGVMRVESRFNNFAQSNKDARGLMQLRPFVAEDLAGSLGIRWNGPDTLYNPVKNVRMGVAYLAILDRRFHGNLDRTLAAYNMGPNRVREWIASGRELPTGYASLVTDYKKLLGRVGTTEEAGSDLRGPITAIERRMQKKAALVILPSVADVDPTDRGLATGVAVPGLLSGEPSAESAKAAKVEPSLDADLELHAEPSAASSDPELDELLK